MSEEIKEEKEVKVEPKKEINREDLMRALAFQGMYINRLSGRIEPNDLTVYLQKNGTTLEEEIEKINRKVSGLSRRLRLQALIRYEMIQKSKENV